VEGNSRKGYSFHGKTMQTATHCGGGGEGICREGGEMGNLKRRIPINLRKSSFHVGGGGGMGLIGRKVARKGKGIGLSKKKRLSIQSKQKANL